MRIEQHEPAYSAIGTAGGDINPAIDGFLKAKRSRT